MYRTTTVACACSLGAGICARVAEPDLVHRRRVWKTCCKSQDCSMICGHEECAYTSRGQSFSPLILVAKNGQPALGHLSAWNAAQKLCRNLSQSCPATYALCSVNLVSRCSRASHWCECQGNKGDRKEANEARSALSGYLREYNEITTFF